MADVKACENSKAGNKLINELQYVKFIYIQCGHSCNSLCCGAGLPLYLAKSTWKDATTSEFAVRPGLDIIRFTTEVLVSHEQC